MCFSMNKYKFVHFDHFKTRVISAQTASFYVIRINGALKIVKLVSESIISCKEVPEFNEMKYFNPLKFYHYKGDFGR